MPKWDTLSHGRCYGKRIPDWSLKTGYSFRNAAQAESASQIPASEWDAPSG